LLEEGRYGFELACSDEVGLIIGKTELL